MIFTSKGRISAQQAQAMIAGADVIERSRFSVIVRTTGQFAELARQIAVALESLGDVPDRLPDDIATPDAVVAP